MKRLAIYSLLFVSLCFFLQSSVISTTVHAQTPDKTNAYIVGDSIAYGLHLTGLESALNKKLGGTTYINYGGGRSITTTGGGNLVAHTAGTLATGLQAVDTDKDKISQAGVIIIEFGTNLGESNFEKSLKEITAKVKSYAPSSAQLYWVDIGATYPQYIPKYNARNKVIYGNASSLDYKVISRYKANFGNKVDPLNIDPNLQNTPGWDGAHGMYKATVDEIVKSVTGGGGPTVSAGTNDNTTQNYVSSTKKKTNEVKGDGTCNDGIDNSVPSDGKADYYGVDTDKDGVLDLEPDPSCIAPEATEMADISNSKIISCYNYCTFSDLLKTINNIIVFLITTIFIPIVILLFMYAGFKYITAQGDPKKIVNLKKMVANILIGMLLVLCSWLIVKVILSILVKDEDSALQFLE